MYSTLKSVDTKSLAATARSWPVKITILILLLSVLLLTHNSSHAAPSGADLLEACTQSVRDGFDSMIGKMCTWYVTPCDCNIDKSIPLVCLPESVPTETLAGLVIAGLTKRPDLQQFDATHAAALILADQYPCP